MKCIKCGETDHASDAVFCHVCGCKLKTSKGKRKGRILLAVLLSVIIIAVIIGVVVLSSQKSYTPQKPYLEETEQYYMTQVKNTIQALRDATVTNDYNRIAELYAYNVDRYHSIYNVTKYEVVERYKKYDDKFGVYNKTANIRWNTLQVEQKPYGGYSVFYVEDYHIDRYDKSKYTDFVLEQYIELDESYRIVSIYDVQLSKH